MSIEFGKSGNLGVGGKSEFRFAMAEESSFSFKLPPPPDPETPTAEWIYDCPCGEQHRLAVAITPAVICAATGVELNEEKRFGTQIRPYKEAFPTDFRWADPNEESSE